MTRKAFIDGTPIPEDYLQRVSEAFKAALDAVAGMGSEQLDDLEREIEHERQRKRALVNACNDGFVSNVGGHNARTLH